MTLQEIKNQIESNLIINSFLIFQCNENFIAHQYVDNISKVLNLKIEYVQDLNSLNDKSIDLFFSIEDKNDTLRVYHTDTFDFPNDSLLNEKNLIIITKKVDKSTQSIYNEYIIEINTLEHWCVKDYMYSILKSVDNRYIDWLMDNCNYDINRLQLEAEKLLVFEENERNIIFNQMLEDDAFSDITNKTIFDFTDAIVKKDIAKLSSIYNDIENMDVEAIGVVTVLYQNFKKLLQVWMSTKPTPESTGLNSKQIYAISKLPRVWNEAQLVSILDLLTSIDYRIKTGVMPMNILRDYLVVNILGR